MPQYPCLLLDEQLCRRNIRAMAGKASGLGLHFRPHCKTHQSATIAGWFREAGVTAIAVSSLPMARYFIAGGWDDITLALPLIPQWVDDLNRISAQSGVKIHLLADHPHAVAACLPALDQCHKVFIKVDHGYGRAGIPTEEQAEIFSLAASIRDCGHTFAGILIHQGNNYRFTNRNQLMEFHRNNMRSLEPLVASMKRAFPGAICSWGDTPSCTVAEHFDPADEMRPGNFVFYDLMQAAAGVCSPDDIAVTLAAPVLSVYPGKGRMVLHAGAVHLSKERLSQPETFSGYGLITRLDGHKRGSIIAGLKIMALSQEHGIVQGSPEVVEGFRPGDLLGVIPVHSCLTADLMRGYITGSGERITMMPVPEA